MAFVSRDGLKRLLFQNVVEVKNERKYHRSDTRTRRFFCVGAYPNFHNNPFLNTTAAQTTLRYRFPKGFPPYNPKPYYNPDEKNLVITWDIFMQDYRSIYIYRANLIRVWPINNPSNLKAFWNYFNTHINNMSAQEKLDFFKR